jgi:hypothetical protein
MKTVITSQGGDFFDLVSFREYGSEYYMNRLIDANLDERLTVRFDQGTVLEIPEVSPIPIEGLPPWRQAFRV